MADDSISSMSLIELFRAEVNSHAAAIETGLDALASDGEVDLAALAYSAQSIGGAARIVGIDAIAVVAQALEVCFDAAHEHRIAIGTVSLATLRRGLDLLRQSAELSEEEMLAWATQRRAAISGLVDELERVAAGRAAVTSEMAITSIGSAHVDMSLIDLFRMEAESHVSSLASGLLGLERDPGHPDVLNELMRAAHSIKGAARIVNIDLAVTLAHAMEDCFLAALDRRVLLGADEIDLLLGGTDWLLQIARTGGAADPEAEAGVADLTRHIDDLIRQSPTPAAAAAAPEPARDDVRAHVTVDRSIRVTAQNVDRLMSLAGESLVEVRRLEPFAGALHKLSIRQRQLIDTLDQLQHLLRDSAVGPRAEGLIADAKARALECRHALGGRQSELDAYARRAEDLTGRLYREAIACRMRPFGDGLPGFPRMVRDLSRKLGKQIDLVIAGDGVGVDRDILERLEAPLNHMLRNAIDHGLETPEQRQAAGKPERGTLRLEARHWAGMLTVTVTDDGRGIDRVRLRERIVQRGLVDADTVGLLTDAEVLDHVFAPGLSTATQVTEISGRGVGLDVVRNMVQEVGGSVRIESELGVGTSLHLQLPITLSVIRAVVVEIAGEPYAFPMMRIERIVRVAASDLRTLENIHYFMLDDKSIGLVPAREVLELEGGEPSPSDGFPVVVVSDRTRRYGMAVDRFLGERDLVIRPLDRRLGKVADVSAASMLTDGTPLLILDVDDLLRSTERLVQGGRLGKLASKTPELARRKRVLIVDDSITVREVQRQILANRGYQVDVAVDGIDGWHLLRDGEFDLVISDIDMPRMSGIELVKSIKQDPRLRGVPVMIVSYKDREEDRRRGLDAGANYYLTKSAFHDELLLDAVVDLIGEPA